VGYASYWETLNLAGGAFLYVEFQTVGRDVVDYSLVLVLRTPEGIETVRVYDATHGFNEMHRFRQGDGKRQGVPFHSGTLGEGMRTAMKSIKRNFQQMIEGWEGA
jgi:hypothetical protein